MHASFIAVKKMSYSFKNPFQIFFKLKGREREKQAIFLQLSCPIQFAKSSANILNHMPSNLETIHKNYK